MSVVAQHNELPDHLVTRRQNGSDSVPVPGKFAWSGGNGFRACGRNGAAVSG